MASEVNLDSMAEMVQEDQLPKLESAQHPRLLQEEHRGCHNRCHVLGARGVTAGCEGET